VTDVQLGPVVLSGARFAAAIGLMAFLGVAAWLGRRDERLGNWAWNSALLLVIGARVGFVLENARVYLQDPLSVLYVWQGGFSPVWGIAAALLYTLLARVGRQALPVAAAGLFAWAGAGLFVAGPPPADMTLPDVSLASLGGEPVALSAFRGRPVVLNLWASWCPPCRREMPMMIEVDRERGDVPIVFVNQGEGAPQAQAFLRQLAGEPEHVLLDPRSQTGSHFRAVGMPTTLFIAADGTVLHRHAGEISRAELERQMARLSRTD
jgi:thiol-disulfide isomerase/thioredoxin